VSKNKLFVISIFVSFVALLLAAGNTKASVGPSVLSIQTLPSYINTNNFKLSCTSNGASAQFYVSKHGDPYIAFGPAINLASDPCIVQVTSSQVNNQSDYKFKVVVDSAESETSTIYDASGPSPVSGYYKEKINDGFYKIHYRSPNDADFDRVVIYRGDTSDFSADGSHEIARVAGSPDSDMTYDDHFSPDTSKTYYYALRAIDRAGNSSSLEGDSVSSNPSQVLGTSATPTGSVVILPQEKGSVLGSEASPTASAEPQASTENEQTQGVLSGLSTAKKLAIGAGIIILGSAIYFFSKRK
jgi:hypothetical protein